VLLFSSVFLSDNGVKLKDFDGVSVVSAVEVGEVVVVVGAAVGVAVAPDGSLDSANIPNLLCLNPVNLCLLREEESSEGGFPNLEGARMKPFLSAIAILIEQESVVQINEVSGRWIKYEILSQF